MKQRTCQTCGVVFPGGPRAYYCPDCRAERKKAAELRCRERKAAGKTRAIGSTDFCAVCGKPYIVAGGLQQFCADCWSQRERDDALARYHADPDSVQKRRDRRADGAPESECIVCEKPYKQTGHWLTCSRECSRIHADQLRAQWAAEHPERRAELNKDWYRRFFESLTPEELEQYKEKRRISARNRTKKEED